MNTNVSVTIPEMKLDLADLVFLKGLLPGGMRCRAKDKTRNKLIFLGLIEQGTLPPCPKEVQRYLDAFPAEIKRAEKALQQKNWAMLYSAAYELKHGLKRPEAKQDLVLTAAGKEVLRRGQATSKLATAKACA